MPLAGERFGYFPNVAQQPNYAAWGTQSRMRLLAAVGLGAGLFLVIAGVVTTINSGHGGVVLLVVGGLVLAFWGVVLPRAKRVGKV